MKKSVVQRAALSAAALTLLVGCGESNAATTAASPSESVSPGAEATASESSAAPAPSTTESAVVADDEALRVAVQGYSDAFLGGQAATAYDYFSARCQDQVELSYFTGIVMAASQVYGAALPITSYDAQVSGDLARVSYTYDVTALNQASEPWARENGAWKQDDC